jgi:hypothetical protein
MNRSYPNSKNSQPTERSADHGWYADVVLKSGEPMLDRRNRRNAAAYPFVERNTVKKGRVLVDNGYGSTQS